MRQVLGLDEIGRTQIGEVGGKGAQLGELKRIEGISVPPGFCVTTEAYQQVLAEAVGIEALLDRLARLQVSDGEAIRTLSAEARRVIEAVPVPDDLAAEIETELTGLGEHNAYAVRSSATAEDLPGASFAGQQDSYLDVVGLPSILEHISRCWASLFTERAVIYRLRTGFDHRAVQMAVVVQRMVPAAAAGVLFTADPVSSNRKLATIEAVPGLGEALVSGLVNADGYTLRDGAVIAKTVAADQPVLTDAQAVRLTDLGRRIEAHFGSPQDIEWCLVGDEFWFVQSRPITTLFPIPAQADENNHVYLSVGHQQMMTDPLKPLGLSVWQLTTPRRMAEAGGRLFVDVAPALASPGRDNLLDVMGRSDPLMRDAMQTVLDRGDFVGSRPQGAPSGGPPQMGAGLAIDPDPAIVHELIAFTEAAVTATKQAIQDLSGPALLDFILGDFEDLRRVLHNPESTPVIMVGMESAWWLNDHLQEWLGETNAADTLAQSAPYNVTSEMGLALLDVADVIRPHPEVVAYLQQIEEPGDRGSDFLAELAGRAGGAEARDAILGFLDRYGMRCVGEIDITRTRWSEDPATLVPTILNNVRNCEPGAGSRRFEDGERRARDKEQELLARVRALPDGEDRAAEVKRMIDRVRAFSGYREYPKYGMICRYFLYKQALLRDAGRLVQSQVLREKDDIYYLRLDELREVVRTQRADAELIRRRREEFASYAALTPPRVLTSDGEALAGSYRREDLPPGALAGLAVSAGTVEGPARVVIDLAQADLEPGDILVTPYTDPSWTPLFVSIAGLVTEVGGLMTHGAVIAREYGLPAVIGVQRATELIRDGHRIRLHGTEGYVEILTM